MNPSYSTPHQPRPTLRTPARTGDAAASSAAPHARLSQRSTTSLAALFAALMALALVVATAGPASAHDELVRTNPQADAKLEKAPTTLELTFSGNIQDIGSEVRVTDSHGTDMTRGTLAAQNTAVSQPLREGGDEDETYTVTWRVVSQDGHPIEGTFTYTVGDGAATAASPAPVASADASQGANGAQEDVSGTGIPSWVLPVAGGAIALVLLLVILAFATRPKQR
ncbi:copper resistance CopC family protein [Kocuria marina]|uniref:copper resistance CopC family protein n=1 Tax=Kocuria marina TaxID=223184 RepID=UPI0011AA41DD|nr:MULTISPECIES: copper resistance CopC family protein [Kocuria]MCT2022068.1 copper resistance protein CopC [Kocuria marina]